MTARHQEEVVVTPPVSHLKTAEAPAPLTLDDLRDGRAFVTIEQFATMPGSPSRGVCYEAARLGQLPTLRLGQRILIPVPRLLALLGVELDGAESQVEPDPEVHAATP